MNSHSPILILSLSRTGKCSQTYKCIPQTAQNDTKSVHLIFRSSFIASSEKQILVGNKDEEIFRLSLCDLMPLHRNRHRRTKVKANDFFLSLLIPFSISNCIVSVHFNVIY